MCCHGYDNIYFANEMHKSCIVDYSINVYVILGGYIWACVILMKN